MEYPDRVVNEWMYIVSDQLKPKEDITVVNESDDLNISRPLQNIDQSSDINFHRYECRSCGYVYDPKEGVKKLRIDSGTSFMDLNPADFKCPVCRLGKESFIDIGPASQPSGFEENLQYGFGINNLTSGQKNVLIFGSLAFAFACFLSLYSLH